MSAAVLEDASGKQFIVSRVAALLRSNVQSATAAATNFGLTTATILAGQGFTEEEYELAAYQTCLLAVSGTELPVAGCGVCQGSVRPLALLLCMSVSLAISAMWQCIKTYIASLHT